jgi:hypothetical protein
MLYLLDAPLIILGILMLFTKNKKVWLFLISWLLISPLATSLVGKAYGLRSLAMLPIPQIFAAYGLYQFYLWSKSSKLQQFIFPLFLFLYSLSVANWLHRYAYQYPAYGKYWYDGAMYEAIEYARERQDQYDQIIITQSYGETSMYYAFYNRVDPLVYKQAKDNRVMVDGVPMVNIGKYYFGDIRPKGPIEQMDLPHNTLLIVQPYFEYSEGTIKARDDGRPIFQIFSFPTVHMKSNNTK